jgi:RNA-splicing ligase RtcB
MKGQSQRKHIAIMQRARAGMAFRDERYDLNRAKHTKTPSVKAFYTHEAAIDRYWGNRRLKSAKSGKPL